MSGTNALLAEFVRTGSEQAFRELVTGYLNLVFSTAVRLLDGDKRLAEDVSQHVFIDLARKAVELPEDVQLGGWLYCHTCFLARKARRRERRRRARELRAVEMLSLADFTEENLRNVGFVLDEAINELKVEDRTAILLRFFEQLDFSSIGTQMDCSEDAARMRVSRAVERLGNSLKRRGVTLSAAGLVFVLTAKVTTAAPIGLASTISHLSLVTASKSGVSLALLKEICFTRLNVGLASAAVAVALTMMLFLERDSLQLTDLQRSGGNLAGAIVPTSGGAQFMPQNARFQTLNDDVLNPLLSFDPKSHASISNLLALARTSESSASIIPETLLTNNYEMQFADKEKLNLNQAILSVLQSAKDLNDAAFEGETPSNRPPSSALPSPRPDTELSEIQDFLKDP